MLIEFVISNLFGHGFGPDLTPVNGYTFSKKFEKTKSVNKSRLEKQLPKENAGPLIDKRSTLLYVGPNFHDHPSNFQQVNQPSSAQSQASAASSSTRSTVAKQTSSSAIVNTGNHRAKAAGLFIAGHHHTPPSSSQQKSQSAAAARIRISRSRSNSQSDSTSQQSTITGGGSGESIYTMQSMSLLSKNSMSPNSLQSTPPTRATPPIVNNRPGSRRPSIPKAHTVQIATGGLIINSGNSNGASNSCQMSLSQQGQQDLSSLQSHNDAVTSVDPCSSLGNSMRQMHQQTALMNSQLKAIKQSLEADSKNFSSINSTVTVNNTNSTGPVTQAQISPAFIQHCRTACNATNQQQSLSESPTPHPRNLQPDTVERLNQFCQEFLTKLQPAEFQSPESQAESEENLSPDSYSMEELVFKQQQSGNQTQLHRHGPGKDQVGSKRVSSKSQQTEAESDAESRKKDFNKFNSYQQNLSVPGPTVSSPSKPRTPLAKINTTPSDSNSGYVISAETSPKRRPTRPVAIKQSTQTAASSSLKLLLMDVDSDDDEITNYGDANQHPRLQQGTTVLTTTTVNPIPGNIDDDIDKSQPTSISLPEVTTVRQISSESASSARSKVGNSVRSPCRAPSSHNSSRRNSKETVAQTVIKSDTNLSTQVESPPVPADSPVSSCNYLPISNIAQQQQSQVGVGLGDQVGVGVRPQHPVEGQQRTRQAKRERYQKFMKRASEKDLEQKDNIKFGSRCSSPDSDVGSNEILEDGKRSRDPVTVKPRPGPINLTVESDQHCITDNYIPLINLQSQTSESRDHSESQSSTGNGIILTPTSQSQGQSGSLRSPNNSSKHRSRPPAVFQGGHGMSSCHHRDRDYYHPAKYVKNIITNPSTPTQFQSSQSQSHPNSPLRSARITTIDSLGTNSDLNGDSNVGVDGHKVVTTSSSKYQGQSQLQKNQCHCHARVTTPSKIVQSYYQAVTTTVLAPLIDRNSQGPGRRGSSKQKTDFISIDSQETQSTDSTLTIMPIIKQTETSTSSSQQQQQESQYQQVAAQPATATFFADYWKERKAFQRRTNGDSLNGLNLFQSSVERKSNLSSHLQQSIQNQNPRQEKVNPFRNDCDSNSSSPRRNSAPGCIRTERRKNSTRRAISSDSLTSFASSESKSQQNDAADVHFVIEGHGTNSGMDLDQNQRDLQCQQKMESQTRMGRSHNVFSTQNYNDDMNALFGPIPSSYSTVSNLPMPIIPTTSSTGSDSPPLPSTSTLLNLNPVPQRNRNPSLAHRRPRSITRLAQSNNNSNSSASSYGSSVSLTSQYSALSYNQCCPYNTNSMGGNSIDPESDSYDDDPILLDEMKFMLGKNIGRRKSSVKSSGDDETQSPVPENEEKK